GGRVGGRRAPRTGVGPSPLRGVGPRTARPGRARGPTRPAALTIPSTPAVTGTPGSGAFDTPRPAERRQSRHGAYPRYSDSITSAYFCLTSRRLIFKVGVSSPRS